ncbi:MAG: hypothetical protein S4CHLAM2_16670 [Chlamydiales bacterium]|nr:hypothetical protein [Chlamydiales bacterium]
MSSSQSGVAPISNHRELPGQPLRPLCQLPLKHNPVMDSQGIEFPICPRFSVKTQANRESDSPNAKKIAY